jgi:hypothetical protein
MTMVADQGAAKIVDAADQPVVIRDDENEEELFRGAGGSCQSCSW